MQGELFELAPIVEGGACADGKHSKLIASAPQFLERGVVNVDFTCQRCGLVVETISYSASGWANEQRCRGKRG